MTMAGVSGAPSQDQRKYPFPKLRQPLFLPQRGICLPNRPEIRISIAPEGPSGLRTVIPCRRPHLHLPYRADELLQGVDRD